MKKKALTSTYIVLILGIILIIVSIFIVNVVKKYQEKSFETAYKNQVQKISNMIDNLVWAENQDNFFSTSMYVDTKQENYSSTAGNFLVKYIGIKHNCENKNIACFAPRYRDEKKARYIPNFEGACAMLKNGIGICLKPQIGDQPAGGIMDLNGKSGPNILGKDLRTFEITKREKPPQINTQPDNIITTY